MIRDTDKITASVDWLDLSITTLKRTNGQTIFKKTKLHAAAQNPELSGADHNFVIRIQDPASWWDVERTLERFSQAIPIDGEAELVGIELSIDVRREAASIEELADLTTHLYTLSSNLASENRRLVGPVKGSTKGIADRKAVEQHFRDLLSLFVGNKKDGRTQRFYVKTVDCAGRIALPAPAWSARVENTYHREPTQPPCGEWWLPSNFIACSDIQFENAARHFNLRNTRHINAGSLEEKVILKIPQLGERKVRAVKSGGNRLHATITQADTKTNRRIYDALRCLSARWKKLPKRYRDATVMHDYKRARTSLLHENAEFLMA